MLLRFAWWGSGDTQVSLSGRARTCVRPLSQQLKGDNKTLLLVVREKSALSQILDCDSDLSQTIWTAVTKAEAPLGFPSYGMETSPRHIQGTTVTG